VTVTVSPAATVTLLGVKVKGGAEPAVWIVVVAARAAALCAARPRTATTTTPHILRIERRYADCTGAATIFDTNSGLLRDGAPRRY
jgi:hypothetical protein